MHTPEPPKPSDESLVQKIQQGDEKSFSLLTIRYRGMLYGIVGKYRNIPSIEPEDLLQEATTALHRAALSYQATRGASFRTFANRVVENKLIDIARKHQNIPPPLSPEVTEQELCQKNRTKQPIEKLLEQSEEADAFFKRTKRILSSFEYQVLLEYLNNGSYQEIANRLQVDTKSVDNALQRIRRKMDPDL